MFTDMGETEIRTLLNDARSKGWADQTLVQRSIEMAREVYASSLNRMRAEERGFVSAMRRLSTDAQSRQLMREVCKIVLHGASDSAEELKSLLSRYGGAPTFFRSMGRLRIKAAVMAPRSMQGAAMAEVKRVFRSTFGELVLSTHMGKVSRRAESLRKEGMRVVLQPLTPRVFGCKGAERYERNLHAILSKQAGVGIVVEAHRLYPEMSPSSPEYSVRRLTEKLQRLFTAAREVGGRPIVVKTHCSDTMEIVIHALKRVLSSPEMDGAEASIELPAYLRTSLTCLREIADWAETRSLRGATPLRILLVKGDYLDEQRTCSAKYGTQDQLCEEKSETDMNFVTLLEAAVACSERAITPVVGTLEVMHLCYAVLLWARSGRKGMPPVSLVYGLGNHTGRVLAELGCAVDLVAGVAAEESEASAFERYLMRTLHELSRPGSYLIGCGAAESETIDWSAKAKPIMAAHSKREKAQGKPHETDVWEPGSLEDLIERAEVDSYYAAAREEKERPQQPIPLRLGGKNVCTPLTCIHRSLIVQGLEDYRYDSADYAAVDQALAYAQKLAREQGPSMEERAATLRRAARELKKRRAEFVGVLVRDAGCTVADAAAELRDAQDALRCVATQDEVWRGLQDGAEAQPLGVAVVSVGAARPLFDAAEGIAAAWMGGNAILYKPASYSVLLASRLSELLNDAGIPVISLPCADYEIGQRLMSDKRVDAVICSASAEQAKRIVQANPGATVLATPAHGPSVYLSESCDWAAAVREVASSSFSRSGQGSSCPHIVFVHVSLCKDPAFCAAIQDIVESQEPRPTWLEGAALGPISSPLGEGERRLLAGEGSGVEWWVTPRAESSASQLWSPGLCSDVQPRGDFVRYGQHLPLLGIVCVENVHEAAEAQMRISQGSRAVIYSQDEDEIATWMRETDCRRVCVNCCPAVRCGVFPEPMWKTTQQGAVGPMRGLASGVAALCRWVEHERPALRSARRNLEFDPKDILPTSSNVEAAMRLSAAADSISYWWEHEFGKEHKLAPADGIQATVSYRPEHLCLRVEKKMSDEDLAIMLMAAMQTRSRISLSLAEPRNWITLFCEQYGTPLTCAKRTDFEANFGALASQGIVLRAPGAGDETVAQAAACGLRIDVSPVVANGRLELMRYMEERVVIRPIGHIPQE